MEAGDNEYIYICKTGIMISHRIETHCPIWLSYEYVIMKFVTLIIFLVEFDICSLEARVYQLITQ